MKKNKITKIAIALLALCMCLNVGTSVVKAWESEPYSYTFHYEEYGEPDEYITGLSPKYSNNSMRATCSYATAPYYVHAVALSYYGMPDDYNDYKYQSVDVSNGYSYYLNTGMAQNNIYNWAYEWGYNFAGLYCTYTGDSEFSANGIFWAD